MSTTKIPPGHPLPPAPRAEIADLYDAHGWESVYREMHQAPALLIQLQDDLSRSRQREAFWISVVVHLVLVIVVVNSPKLEKYFPKRPVMVVTPNDWMRQKELTYLELPKDAQKITKRPDTNVISDKDRIATSSRTPQLDRKELKKILDSSRAQPPGPPATESTPPPLSVAQNPSAQQQAPPPPAPIPDQVAKLEAPPVSRPKPSFQTKPMSAGSAIEQAARAAAANRGGYGGDSGDFGLSQGRQPAQAIGPLDVLSDTMGVDFGPYLSRVLHDVRENWYNLIPEIARAPLMKRGKVSIEFAILKDGRVAGMKLAAGSGDVALDRAAWGGVTASNPFPPLPGEFSGQYLALRFHFYYNPERAELR
jgi:TonB family protein